MKCFIFIFLLIVRFNRSFKRVNSSFIQAEISVVMISYYIIPFGIYYIILAPIFIKVMSVLPDGSAIFSSAPDSYQYKIQLIGRIKISIYKDEILICIVSIVN